MLRKLKDRFHRLYKHERRKALLYALILIAILAVGYVAAQIYWTRTVDYTFTVTGIDAGLLVPTVAGYLTRQNATSLTDGKVLLTVYSENFNQIWLNLTWTSNAQGLQVNATGQYYNLIQLWQGGWELIPVGSPFNASGYNIIDKTKIMYGTPGYGLIVTFTLDTELVTTPGNYTASFRFDLGFV